jgi:hypothetical protein
MHFATARPSALAPPAMRDEHERAIDMKRRITAQLSGILQRE